MPSIEHSVFTVGQKVLLVEVLVTKVRSLVEEVQSQVGSSGLVQSELHDALSKLLASSFDVVYIVDPLQINKVDFSNILRVLKPSGLVFFNHLAVTASNGSAPSVDHAQSALKLNGFIGVNIETISAANLQDLREQFKDLFVGNVLLCRARANKPAYEIGDSMPLKLGSKNEVVKAWTLSANDMFDDDVDVLDSDDVLDDIDLKKPDPATLKAAACSVEAGSEPAKRKACKNCSCGLAEELEAKETQVDTAAAKSSCGSCYLGDAFRCSSCPYRGLPAFKPGEKIQLPTLTMEDDI